MATATKKKKPSKNGKAAPKLKKIKDRDELLEVLSGCSLTFSWWGTLKMVPREQQEMAAKAIDADRKAVKTQKVKIDTDMPEWKDLQTLRSSIVGWYDFRTFPYCVRGHRLFRREMREEIWEGGEAASEGHRRGGEAAPGKTSRHRCVGETDAG